MSMSNKLPSEYFSDKQLAQRFGVTPNTIWRWVKHDLGFPKPVMLSRKCTRWKGDQIEAWEIARSSTSTPG